MESRPKNIIKLHAAQRYLLWHYLHPLIDNIRVAEFPKSGGTWLCQMLGELYGLPYPRNTRLPLRPCIQHSHYSGPTTRKTIVVIRDGRDVMTSAYFHFLIYSKEKPRFIVDKWRTLVGQQDYVDVKSTMPVFIEKFNNNFKIAGRIVRWSDHVLSYDYKNKNICLIKYEDLLINTTGVLEEISKWLDKDKRLDFERVVRKFDFKNQSSRNPGEEDSKSFLRKGISGDWKTYFTKEAIEVFEKYDGGALKYYSYV